MYRYGDSSYLRTKQCSALTREWGAVFTSKSQKCQENHKRKLLNVHKPEMSQQIMLMPTPTLSPWLLLLRYLLVSFPPSSCDSAVPYGCIPPLTAIRDFDRNILLIYLCFQSTHVSPSAPWSSVVLKPFGVVSSSCSPVGELQMARKASLSGPSLIRASGIWQLWFKAPAFWVMGAACTAWSRASRSAE